MDFDIPADLAAYLPSWTSSSRPRSGRWSSRTTTSASSTTGARTPGPTGTAAGCRTGSGRRCCARPGAAPTRPATTGTRSRRSTAAGTAPTSAWRSSASTWPQGPRPALRPAERAHDRGQQRRPAADDRVRHPGAAGRVDRRSGGRPQGLRVRHHRARARLATRPSWRPRASRDGDDWVINGEKTLNTGVHAASHDLIFARTQRQARRRRRASPRS